MSPTETLVVIGFLAVWLILVEIATSNGRK